MEVAVAQTTEETPTTTTTTMRPRPPCTALAQPEVALIVTAPAATVFCPPDPPVLPYPSR